MARQNKARVYTLYVSKCVCVSEFVCIHEGSLGYEVKGPGPEEHEVEVISKPVPSPPVEVRVRLSAPQVSFSFVWTSSHSWPGSPLRL